MNLYNENDPKAAAGLRELIRAGLIPEGYVDQRGVESIEQKNLDGFRQCHFFTGIGGWPLALEFAGWPEEREIWTGSCPCQPFSCAGKQRGTADARHLWPVWFQLIRQQRPLIVVGEQVASPIARDWIDGVFADLEAENYTCGKVVLGAHSAGAPHRRQRIFWMADRSGVRRAQHGEEQGKRKRKGPPYAAEHQSVVRMGNSERKRLEGQPRNEQNGSKSRWINPQSERSIAAAGFWDNSEPVKCIDGKSRRTQPGLCPVAYGLPARVVRGITHGAGNAIVPQVAAMFLKAVMEITK